MWRIQAYPPRPGGAQPHRYDRRFRGGSKSDLVAGTEESGLSDLRPAEATPEHRHSNTRAGGPALVFGGSPGALLAAHGLNAKKSQSRSLPAGIGRDRIDHRPDRQLLGARGAEVPMKEIEDLVPAVNRLF